MLRQEPYPISTQMMWIASHPSNPWMAKETYQFATDPVTAKPTVHPELKVMKSSVPDIFDAEDSLIKHLTSMVKIEE